MEQLAIYHQYNIPAIFQAVTHICFKKNTIVFRTKGNLSAPHHLTCFLNIETWKHSPIVLIPIFLADPPYVPTKLKLFTSYSLATRPKHEEDQSALHFLTSKLHFESQHRGKYHFDILPKRVMAIVVAVQTHFVWIDHVVVVFGCDLLH